MKKKEVKRNKIRKRRMVKRRKREQTATIKMRVRQMREKVKKIQRKSRKILGLIPFGRKTALKPKLANRGSITGLFRDSTVCPDRVGAYAADVAGTIRAAIRTAKPLGRP